MIELYIQIILMNLEFEKGKPKLLDLLRNTSSTKENFAEIEHHIHVIKEHCQGICYAHIYQPFYPTHHSPALICHLPQCLSS